MHTVPAITALNTPVLPPTSTATGQTSSQASPDLFKSVYQSFADFQNEDGGQGTKQSPNLKPAPSKKSAADVESGDAIAGALSLNSSVQSKLPLALTMPSYFDLGAHAAAPSVETKPSGQAVATQEAYASQTEPATQTISSHRTVSQPVSLSATPMFSRNLAPTQPAWSSTPATNFQTKDSTSTNALSWQRVPPETATTDATSLAGTPPAQAIRSSSQEQGTPQLLSASMAPDSLSSIVVKQAVSAPPPSTGSSKAVSSPINPTARENLAISREESRPPAPSPIGSLAVPAATPGTSQATPQYVPSSTQTANQGENAVELPSKLVADAKVPQQSDPNQPSSLNVDRLQAVASQPPAGPPGVATVAAASTPKSSFGARPENFAFSLQLTETRDAGTAQTRVTTQSAVGPELGRTDANQRALESASPATIAGNSPQPATQPKGRSSDVARQSTTSGGAEPDTNSAGTKISLLPRTDALPSSLRPTTPDSLRRPVQPTEQPTPAGRQESSGERNPSRSHESPSPVTDTKPASETSSASNILAAGSGLHSNEMTAAPRLDLHPAALAPEAPEPVQTSLSTALHEVQPTLPEIPKPNVSSEILLHLNGTAQDSAAVRVVDRAGTVNVSVHASDPELRSTLRSNLSELTSQLNAQGWKTEAVKTTVAPPNSENRQDPGTHGQRSFSQQQSPNSDRQSQRDRRPSSSWLDELEQQTSGNAGNSGGSNP